MRKKHRLVMLLICLAVAVTVILVMVPAAMATPFVPTITVTPANSPYTIS